MMLLGYIKMEHKKSIRNTLMKERHNKKFHPVHIEESYLSDATFFPVWYFPV